MSQINLFLGEPSWPVYIIDPVNTPRDVSKAYVNIVDVSGVLVPKGFESRVVISPEDYGMSLAEAEGILNNPNSPSGQNGIYVRRFKNNEPQSRPVQMPSIDLDRSYSNTRYIIYWKSFFGPVRDTGSNLTAVYLYPPNVQNSEVLIMGKMINLDKDVEYTVKWQNIPNYDSSDYGVTKPYGIGVRFANNFDGLIFVSGNIDSNPHIFNDTYWVDSNIKEDGVTFTLPYYDSRSTYNDVLAVYLFGLFNQNPDTDESIPRSITIDHNVLKNNFIVDLQSRLQNSFNYANLQKVSDDIVIPKDTIKRTRLSLGVKDIYVSENTYPDKGVYVSDYFRTDYGIYTLSLTVDEYIPEYEGANPYDLIQYFIEYNNGVWERISPITRDQEISTTGAPVPKMFIFDKGLDLAFQNVKFIEAESVNIFRVKIVFDMTALGTNKFIPPEIRNYRCLIYDKNRFIGI